VGRFDNYSGLAAGQLAQAQDKQGSTLTGSGTSADNTIVGLGQQVGRVEGKLETLMWGLGILAIVLLGAMGKLITQTVSLHKAIADQNTALKGALADEARRLEKSMHEQALTLQRVEATLTAKVRNLSQAAGGTAGA
jgi:hypothetical protein